MLHSLHSEVTAKWLVEYWLDFRRRFISLLAYQFHTFPTSLALSVVVNKAANPPHQSKLSHSPIELGSSDKTYRTYANGTSTCFLTQISIMLVINACHAYIYYTAQQPFHSHSPCNALASNQVFLWTFNWHFWCSCVIQLLWGQILNQVSKSC